MKSYWPCDFIFLTLVVGIGFILPWWSIFIICFLWSYFKIAGPTKIMLSVFFSYLGMICVLGANLLKVLDLSFLIKTSNPLSANYALAILTSLLFSSASGFFAHLAQDFRKQN